MDVLIKKINLIDKRIEVQIVKSEAACVLSKLVEAQRDQSFEYLSGMSHILMLVPFSIVSLRNNMIVATHSRRLCKEREELC